MRKICWILLASLLLSACGTLRLPPASPTTTPAHFRSPANHLEVKLPPGWAASEGPELLAKPFVGLAAFNSWGEEQFWARQVESKTAGGVAYTYSPETVLSQIPSDSAYIVLIDFAGGPRMASGDYGPEHSRQDLNDLWIEDDCRMKGHVSIEFFKWGRRLRLEIYCGPEATDQAIVDVNRLIDSWRFDRVPAGDIGWATATARELLPSAVDPRAFPILSGGPTASSEQQGDTLRMTRAEVIEGDVVAVTFLYRWDVLEIGPMTDDCPPESCHWWRFEARPDGEVVLVAEGGAGLPGETERGTPTPEAGRPIQIRRLASFSNTQPVGNVTERGL